MGAARPSPSARRVTRAFAFLMSPRGGSARFTALNCSTPRLILVQTFSMSPVERSEEHTSELQSLRHLVCRLLLEKKKQNNNECKVFNKTITAYEVDMAIHGVYTP